MSMLPGGAARRSKLPVAAIALFAALVPFILLPWPRSAGSHQRVRASAATSPGVEVVITSADLREALTRMPDIPFVNAAPDAPVVDVNESTRYQVIKGFGGALTDTSAWLMQDELSPNTQRSLMNALFAPSGIHLSFLRIPMGASDFTSARKPYSYDDMPPGASDPQLQHFSIRHDTAYIIPALRQALAINPGMFLLANPWSPPGWMKTDGAMSNPRDAGRLKAADVGPLAQYFVRFLQAYAAQGIPIAAITPQNEPGQASIYPGMAMSERSEAAFVHHSLAPALAGAGLATKIYGYDWGWARTETPYAASLTKSAAAGDLAGISTHCYLGDPAILSALHLVAPSLDEIVAECSPGIMPAPTSEVEIGAMRNWASALALWNLALDPSGGPVQPPNHGCPHCTGIVTVDRATHKVALTRDYYQLGQLSKFVEPGAVRIASNHFVSYRYLTPHGGIATAGLDDAAFENPDGSKVVIAYDNSHAPIAFGVEDDGRYFSYTLRAGSTGTFSWDQPVPKPPG